MKTCRVKNGLTLVEILVVVAIMAILVSAVITVAVRTQQQAEEQVTANTIAILSAALKEFGEYDYKFKGDDYIDHKFPPDCDGSDLKGFEQTLQEALGVPVDSVMVTGNGINNEDYFGSESMYFFLNRVPQSRKILDKIDASLLTIKDVDGVNLTLEIDYGSGVKQYPLVRITDAWGTTLRYEYDEYDTANSEYIKRTFPLITSAGPDRNFDTENDNITNR